MTYDGRVVDANGTLHQVMFKKTTYQGEGGAVAGLIGTFIDLTELRRAEQALRQSEAWNRLLLESAPVAMMVLDGQGRVCQVNARAEELFGYQSGTMVGLAVDAAGHAFVTGYTTSREFPVTPGAYQTAIAGKNVQRTTIPPSDAFVVKLSPDGSSLVYATFLGGTGGLITVGSTQSTVGLTNNVSVTVGASAALTASRDLTLRSNAPALVYQEGNLISLIHDQGKVDNIEHVRGGVIIEGNLPVRLMARYQPFLYDPAKPLPPPILSMLNTAPCVMCEN